MKASDPNKIYWEIFGYKNLAAWKPFRGSSQGAIECELDELLYGECSSQVLFVSAKNGMSAFYILIRVNRLPAKMSITNDQRVNAGLQDRVA